MLAGVGRLINIDREVDAVAHLGPVSAGCLDLKFLGRVFPRIGRLGRGKNWPREGQAAPRGQGRIVSSSGSDGSD